MAGAPAGTAVVRGHGTALSVGIALVSGEFGHVPAKPFLDAACGSRAHRKRSTPSLGSGESYRTAKAQVAGQANAVFRSGAMGQGAPEAPGGQRVGDGLVDGGRHAGRGAPGGMGARSGMGRPTPDGSLRQGSL